MSDHDNDPTGTTMEVSEQVFKQLLADLHAAVKATEADARKRGKVFSEADRRSIFLGFVMGAAKAAAEVHSTMGTYLQWVTLCGCAGSEVRPIMDSGEDQLHQTLHKLATMFPDGKFPPASIIHAGTPEDVIRELSRQPSTPAPEDLN